jgi:FkbM family methyltransferase
LLQRLIDEAAISVVRAISRLPRGGVRAARVLTALRPSLRRYPARTRYGTIICDLSEIVCFDLAVKGTYARWQPDEDAIARIPLDERSVVLDIGANIGVMTRIFARRAAHVHAFEPAPRALALLRANAPDNATIHPVALADRCGTVRFAEVESLDMSSISNEGVEVPARTVDSLGLKPDFIKIDVEGYEIQVLRGARETLKAGPIIMFEALNPQALGECQNEILAANANYSFERLPGGTNFIAWPDQNRAGTR